VGAEIPPSVERLWDRNTRGKAVTFSRRTEAFTLALAAFLVIGPWLGARIVHAQEEADSISYAVGAARVMMLNCKRALSISNEDLETAIWALQQRRRWKRR
jgi:hypothetical protein